MLGPAAAGSRSPSALALYVVAWAFGSRRALPGRGRARARRRSRRGPGCALVQRPSRCGARARSGEHARGRRRRRSSSSAARRRAPGPRSLVVFGAARTARRRRRPAARRDGRAPRHATSFGACRAGATASRRRAAVLEDPFGLARAEVAARPGGRAARLPAPRRRSTGSSRESGAQRAGRPPAAAAAAAGFDLHSVRDYEQGESLRKVHWPTTARRGQLMVKELEDAPRDEVAVLLDAGERRRAPDSSFDVQVRAAGSILRAHARRGRRAALASTRAASGAASPRSTATGARARAARAAEPDGAEPVGASWREAGRRVAGARPRRGHGGLTPGWSTRSSQRALRAPADGLVFVDDARASPPAAAARDRRCSGSRRQASRSPSCAAATTLRAALSGFADGRGGRWVGPRLLYAARCSSSWLPARGARGRLRPMLLDHPARARARARRGSAGGSWLAAASPLRRSRLDRARRRAGPVDRQPTPATSGTGFLDFYDVRVPFDAFEQPRCTASCSSPSSLFRARGARARGAAPAPGRARRRRRRGLAGHAPARRRRLAAAACARRRARAPRVARRKRGRAPSPRSSPAPCSSPSRVGRLGPARSRRTSSLGWESWDSVRPPGSRSPSRTSGTRTTTASTSRRRRTSCYRRRRRPAALLARDDARHFRRRPLDRGSALDLVRPRDGPADATRSARPRAVRRAGCAPDVTIDALRDAHLVGPSSRSRYDARELGRGQVRRGGVGVPPGGAAARAALHGLGLRAAAEAGEPRASSGRTPAAIAFGYLELDTAAAAPPFGSPDVRASRADASSATTLEGRAVQPALRPGSEDRGGARNPYAAAVALEAWLRAAGGFVYDEHPPRAGERRRSSHFVTRTKRGYCQHFAGAMALMLRYLGIPARVAAGFTSGAYDEERKQWTVYRPRRARVGRGLVRRLRLAAVRSDARAGQLAGPYSTSSTRFDATGAAGVLATSAILGGAAEARRLLRFELANFGREALTPNTDPSEAAQGGSSAQQDDERGPGIGGLRRAGGARSRPPLRPRQARPAPKPVLHERSSPDRGRLPRELVDFLA